jgi:hypothetical protein
MTNEEPIWTKLEESYVTHVKSVSGKKYPVFMNPSIHDIRELSKETNAIGFVSHDKKFYVFHGSLLHKDVVPQLGLNFSSEKVEPREAFLGRGNIRGNSIHFSGTNQKIKNPSDISDHHSHLKQWFKD